LWKGKKVVETSGAQGERGRECVDRGVESDDRVPWRPGSNGNAGCSKNQEVLHVGDVSSGVFEIIESDAMETSPDYSRILQVLTLVLYCRLSRARSPPPQPVPTINSNEGDGKTAAEVRIVWTRVRVSLTFYRNGSSFFKNHREVFTIQQPRCLTKPSSPKVVETCRDKIERVTRLAQASARSEARKLLTIGTGSRGCREDIPGVNNNNNNNY